MSTISGVGLFCATGFAGAASLVDSGAGFPQPEIKTTSKRQQGAMWFLWKSMCVGMGTKSYQQDSCWKRAEEVAS
jgi:hypothetical protein